MIISTIAGVAVPIVSPDNNRPIATFLLCQICIAGGFWFGSVGANKIPSFIEDEDCVLQSKVELDYLFAFSYPLLMIGKYSKPDETEPTHKAFVVIGILGALGIACSILKLFQESFKNRVAPEILVIDGYTSDTGSPTRQSVKVLLCSLVFTTLICTGVVVKGAYYGG